MNHLYVGLSMQLSKLRPHQRRVRVFFFGIPQNGMRHRIVATHMQLDVATPIEKHSGKIIVVPRRERERERAPCGQALTLFCA